MKKCHICNKKIKLEMFSKNSSKKDGLESRCKPCNIKYTKSWRKNLEKRIKIPKVKICNMCNKSKESNEFCKNKSHSDGLNTFCKSCYKISYKNRKEKVNKWNREYLRRKRKNNIQFKISERIRVRVGLALKGKRKPASAIKDMGCTIKFLIQYLESLFEKNMNWNNYGINGWHVDHIKPLSLFDLEDKEQFLEACHYTNLQPLWAFDNLKKSNNFER